MHLAGSEGIYGSGGDCEGERHDNGGDHMVDDSLARDQETSLDWRGLA